MSNQDTIEPIRDYLFKYMSGIYHLTAAHMSKKLNHLNIGIGQIPFLMILHFHKGINQDFFTKMLKIDKATTTKSIKKLVQLKYVDRITDPEDKRAYKITLSTLGKTVIPEILKEMALWDEILFQNFTDEEQNQTLIFVSKILGNICKHKNKPFPKLNIKQEQIDEMD